jgi:hypothetical protein
VGQQDLVGVLALVLTGLLGLLGGSVAGGRLVGLGPGGSAALLKLDQATYRSPSGPTNGWENWFSLHGPCAVGRPKLLVQAGLAPLTRTRGPKLSP